jgi:hypothetical protein
MDLARADLRRGTYNRINKALLSYSAIEVRGGWPQMPR